MARGKLRAQRLGDRSDAVADGLSKSLNLPRAAVERVALDRLAQDSEFPGELDACRTAEEWIGQVRQRFGARARLHLRADRPLLVYAGFVKEEIPGTMVRAREVDDGCVALDLYVEREDGADLVIEAVRFGTAPEGVVPLSAVHLASPVPSSRGEVVRKGPNGMERTVWGTDGVRRTYVGGNVLPSQRARFVHPP